MYISFPIDINCAFRSVIMHYNYVSFAFINFEDFDEQVINQT